MEEIKQKIKDWEEWCDFDEDTMNDNIRDLFNDSFNRTELFMILSNLKSK